MNYRVCATKTHHHGALYHLSYKLHSIRFSVSHMGSFLKGNFVSLFPNPLYFTRFLSLFLSLLQLSLFKHINNFPKKNPRLEHMNNHYRGKNEVRNDNGFSSYALDFLFPIFWMICMRMVLQGKPHLLGLCTSFGSPNLRGEDLVSPISSQVS